MTGRRRLALGMLAGLALLVAAGCATVPGSPPDGLGIRFDVVEEPAAFALEGTARRPDRDAPGGYWAVVPGLPRAESAVVRRQGGGKAVVVALFRAPRTAPSGEILLSEAVAAALGIGDAPVPVRIVAVREELELRRAPNRF